MNTGIPLSYIEALYFFAVFTYQISQGWEFSVARCTNALALYFVEL